MPACEHCGKTPLDRTYAVKDRAGRLLRVGSECARRFSRASAADLVRGLVRDLAEAVKVEATAAALPPPIPATIALGLTPHTVDTEKGVLEGKVRGVADVTDGGKMLVSYHVTDEPSKLVASLTDPPADLGEGRPPGDLGCAGIHFSDSPVYWKSRSRRRWELAELSPTAQAKLFGLIEEDLRRRVQERYVTSSEGDRAMRMLEHVRQGVYPLQVLVDQAVNQPYNVSVIQLAERAGIAKAKKPGLVRVRFTGRFFDMSAHGSVRSLFSGDQDFCDELRKYGYDGVYTQAGWSANPELVLWNGKKIVAAEEVPWDADQGGHSGRWADVIGPSLPETVPNVAEYEVVEEEEGEADP